MIALNWGPEFAPQLAQLLLGEEFLKREPAWLGTWSNEVSTYDLNGIATLGQTICNRKDLSSVLNEINVPTMIVHGTVDDAIEIDIAKAMAKRIKHVIFVEMPGAGHCPPLEVPELFTKKLINFLISNGFII